MEELREMVQETVGASVKVDRMRYSLKDDKNMTIAVEEDMDVKMMLKGNDEHGYVYVCNKDSVMQHVSKNVSTTTGRAGAGENGTQGGTSGRRGEGAIEEEMQATEVHG